MSENDQSIDRLQHSSRSVSQSRVDEPPLRRPLALLVVFGRTVAVLHDQNQGLKMKQFIFI